MLKFYAFIEDGIVQNIVPCHGREDAIENARLQYDNPIVIEIGASKCDLMIGDKYENGIFYHFDYTTEDWITVKNQNNDEKEISNLKKEIERLKSSIDDGALTHQINYDTCLFEEYVNFRIGEAINKYTRFLDNAFILHNVEEGENVTQYQVNMSHNNWCGFVNMYVSYKALKEAGIETELYWYDGKANKIIFETEEECLSLMKAWRDQNQRLTIKLNETVKQIYSCEKKADVKAIEISFE